MCTIFSSLFISVFVISSCSQDTKKVHLRDENVTEINLENFESHISNASIIAEQKIIRLETNDDTLIGRADKILVSNERIYVLDSRQVKALFVFDIDGKFLHKIKNTGSGPGEYMNLHDFTIDHQRNIYLLDVGRRKFIKYDSTGRYLEEYHTKFRTIGFSHLKHDNFIFFQRSRLNKDLGDFNHNIIHYSTSKGITQKLLPYHEFYDAQGFPQIYHQIRLYASKQTLLYRPNFSYSVYDVSKEETTPKYIFNCGEKSIPKDYFRGIRKSDLTTSVRELDEKDFIWTINNVYENEEYMVCNFAFKKDYYFLFYSKKTKNYMVKSGRDLHRNEEAKGDMQPLGVYKDYFIGIDRHTSLTSTQPNKYDNPYLILYKIHDV